MPRSLACLGFLAILFAAVIACDRQDDVLKVSLEQRAEPTPVAEPAGPEHLRVAVGGMITPQEGFAYYRKFLDHLGEKLGRPVDFVDRESYREINQLLQAGEVDVAFVCGGPYVDGHDEFGLELIAAPVAHGGTVYYSYIIVAADSPLQHFAELRGKTFAFTDPLSNSGTLVPTYMLAKIGETPGTFFQKTSFLGAHDRSIRAVADGLVDGAAVDSLIWEYAARTNPALTSRTRVIVTSPAYGIPPVVASPHLAADLKERVRQVLLNAHRDAQGKEIMQGMMIERFEPIEDRAYESIREMKRWLAQRKQPGAG